MGLHIIGVVVYKCWWDSVEGYPIQVGRYGGKFIVVDGKKYYVGSDKQRKYARNKILGRDVYGLTPARC